MARIAFLIQMFILDKCQIYYDVTLCHKKQQKLSEFGNPNDFCFYCHVYYESPSQDTDAAGWNHSTSCNGHAFMLSRHCCESSWILATSNNFTLEERSIITRVDINTLTNKTAHYSSSFYRFRHKVHLCNDHVFIWPVFMSHLPGEQTVWPKEKTRLHLQSQRNSLPNGGRIFPIYFFEKHQIKMFWFFFRFLKVFSFTLSLPALPPNRPTGFNFILVQQMAKLLND